MEQVSVEAGLRRGNLLLKVIPVALLCLGIMGGMSAMMFRVDLHPGISLLIGFLVGSVACWLWWSFAVTRWRIWALMHVRNINELMDQAVQDELIRGKGSWLERTEIRTRKQRDLLIQLEARRQIPDEYADDPSVPPVTVITFSRSFAFMSEIGLGLMVIGGWVYFIRISSGRMSLLLHLFMGGPALWLLYSGGRKYFNRKPQLTISSTGISISEVEHYPWSDVFNEEFVVMGSGRNTYTALRFYHAHGDSPIELNINELATSKSKLRHALKIHRYRWEQGLGDPKLSA